MRITSHIFLPLICALFILNSCVNVKWGPGIDGEGPVKTVDLNLTSFESVHLANSGNVFITHGNAQSVNVEGQQNLIDILNTEIDNGTWKITFKESVRKYEKFNIYITLPTLKNVRVSGSGSIESDSQFKGLNDMELHVSGSGDLELLVEANNINSSVTGSGHIKLSGTANRLEAQISGSGKIKAYDLQVKDCKVRISGSGDADVNVTDNLDAQISGSGDVNYMGNPSVNSKVSGSGNVEKKR